MAKRTPKESDTAIGIRNRVARAVRRSSLDLPGGSVKTAGGEILLRTKGKAYRGRESVLIDAEAVDLSLHLGVAVLFALVDALACHLPARQAVGINPMVALRSE